MKPSIKLDPYLKIFRDGNSWCVLYGEDLQSGVGGFGKTIMEALEDFDRNYEKWG